MKVSSRIAQLTTSAIAVVAILFVVTLRDAYAYVDPGTGAMILQIIGAIVAGALFYFRQIRDKITSWFSRRSSRTPGGDNNG